MEHLAELESVRAQSERQISFVVIAGALQFGTFTGTDPETYPSCSSEDCSIQQLPQKNQVGHHLRLKYSSVV